MGGQQLLTLTPSKAGSWTTIALRGCLLVGESEFSPPHVYMPPFGTPATGTMHAHA